METLSYKDEIVQQYTNTVLKSLREKYPDIEGVKVDVSPDDTHQAVSLKVGETGVLMTPEQAVDLMKQIRRAVVKVNPKALRGK